MGHPFEVNSETNFRIERMSEIGRRDASWKKVRDLTKKINQPVYAKKGEKK